MNAAVNAIRAIDEGEQAAVRPAGSATPGVTIRIIQANQAPPIDRAASPLTIEHEPAPRDLASHGGDE
jgi:hypothetical protein